MALPHADTEERDYCSRYLTRTHSRHFTCGVARCVHFGLTGWIAIPVPDVDWIDHGNRTERMRGDEKPCSANECDNAR